MTADYKTHGQRPHKKPLPGFIWLLIGLALGLFVALIIYLDKQPENKVSFGEAIERDLARLKQQSADKAPAKTVDSDQAKQRSEPRFTYHTILKELEVMIPDEELLFGDSKTDDSPRSLPDDGKQYLLQAGSFQNRRDADRLKARLALLGMQANIEPVTIRQVRWYRVRLGPYADSGTAYRELNQLKQNGITAMAFGLK